jgi:hypothetical protein
MCAKCDELDNKIEHYRKILKLTTERQAIDGINATIADCHAKKKALHPEPVK